MTRSGSLILVGLFLAATPLSLATDIAKRTRRLGDERELLTNAQLEQHADARFAAWSPYEAGYSIGPAAGRDGKPAALCDNPDGTRKLGLSQTIKLDRTEVRPLVVSGWSKAEGVLGSPDADYSLYVDMIYQDGTPQWAHVAAFSCDTHDWEYRRFRIYPAKPVKSLTVNALFRGRKGKVWFNDISVKELAAGSGSMMFDGVPVERRGDHVPQPTGTAEIQIREVATESDFYRVALPPDGDGRVEVPELQLAVGIRRTSVSGNHHRTDVSVIDLAGQDRAIAVYYIVPLDAIGGQWFDNVRQSRKILPQQEYHNTVQTGVGSTGRTSRYPFACVTSKDRAQSLLVTAPSACHLGYHSGTSELYAAFDLSLVKETRPPGSATVTVHDAQTDPKWGLRDTARLFYGLLPPYFDRSRIAKPQGNWMPFQKISSVRQPEDFSFAVHEGDNDVRWDNDHRVQPYVYVEPMTWWLPLPKETPRTYDAVMDVVRSFKEDLKSPNYDIAWAVSLSGTFEHDGRYRLDLLNSPWCDGGVFGNSADPDVAESQGHLNLAHLNMRNLEQSLKKAESEGGLAGVYLDSLEGWGRLLNHRREHFAAADIPLTFDANSYQPVILNAFATQEFTSFISDWLHRRGKLLMANAVPNDFPFLALPLDLLGTETNWQNDGRFAPPDPDWLYVKRTLSWHKPYMFLMNTHFETWTAAMTERYMQICLFYGMFPGFFSENAATNCYFANPAMYDRDRPLFRKYLPVIKQVAEAGWEPITLARADSDDVWLERWGTEPASGLFFTVMNTSDRPRRTTVEIDTSGGTGAPGSRFVTNSQPGGTGGPGSLNLGSRLTTDTRQNSSAPSNPQRLQAKSLLDAREAGRLPRVTVELPPGGVEALQIRPE